MRILKGIISAILVLSLLIPTLVTADSIDAQIAELDTKIKKAQAEYNNLEQKYSNIASKYVAYWIQGDIYSKQPDFIVAGKSAGDGFTTLEKGYFHITNPDSKGILLNKYDGIHYLIKTSIYNGTKVYVMGAAPKDLQIAKTAKVNAKSKLEDLIAQKKVLTDKKEGIMTIKYDNGTYYGKTEGGEPNGYGKYTWNIGTIYEGDWIDGQITGKGKFLYSDGDVYIGGVNNGKYEGVGELRQGYTPAGMYNPKAYYELTAIGEFHDGLLNGKVKLYDSSGNITFEGVYKMGERIEETQGAETYKKWYEKTEYTEKISDTQSRYIDDYAGFKIVYPSSWGKPVIKEIPEISLNEVTTFYKSKNVFLYSYKDRVENYNGSYVDYLKTIAHNIENREKLNIPNAYESYKITTKIGSGNELTITLVAFQENEVSRIELHVYDTSSQEAKEIMALFNEMIGAFELIPGVG